MNKINSYLDALKLYPSDRDALITENKRYTFGELIEAAEFLKSRYYNGTENVGTDNSLSLHEPKMHESRIHEYDKQRILWIQEQTIAKQLICFLAYGDGLGVPVIAPSDVKISDEIRDIVPPSRAYMGVMTSGTSGRQKVLFRTFESWHEFFPIQNEIFGMGEGTKIFMQGSLAFTGNLNLYMAQLATGGTIIAADSFDPRIWKRMIEEEKTDCVYLIPVKLRALKKIYDREHCTNNRILSFVSGSQSMGGSEAREFKKTFPKAEITLYYGASELNYITYIRGSEMKEDTTLVGRAFPDVKVWIGDDHFHVKTSYGILGIGSDAVIGDCGHTDEEGLFYFDGRDDDICNINGRKVSSLRVEEAVRRFPGVVETAVKAVHVHGRDYLKAWIVWEKENDVADNKSIRDFLSERLSDYEIPREIVSLKKFPKTESGKIRKKEL